MICAPVGSIIPRLARGFSTTVQAHISYKRLGICGTAKQSVRIEKQIKLID